MKFRYQKLPSPSHDTRTPLVPRPYLPIYLHTGTKSTRSPYYALLDSGADVVLFPTDLAVEIGITDITTGRGPRPIIGVAGQRADVYYHDLELQLLGDTRRLPTAVGFSDHITMPLLGRSFFTHFTSVIFHEGKEQIEFRV